MWVNKRNDIVNEENKPRGASREQVFRYLKCSAKAFGVYFEGP